MFQANQPYRFPSILKPLFVAEGEGGTATPAPSPAPQITPEIQQLISAALAEQTKGLKAKNDELLGKLKETTTTLKKFEGVDLENYNAYRTALDADEDAKLIAAGKKHEVIQKHTERMRAEHANQLKELQTLVEGEKQRADTYKGAVLDNQIRSVCTDLHKGAVDDALLQARNVFSLDAKGNAVQLDSEGRPVLGKDGKSAFSPAEWIELQRELKPHWFPAGTSGSGSGASKPGDSKGGRTMKRTAFDGLSSTEKAAFAVAGGTVID